MSLREMHEQQKQSSPREQLQELNRQSRTELENSLLKEALAMSSENCEELMKQSNQEQVRAEQNRQRDAEQNRKLISELKQSVELLKNSNELLQDAISGEIGSLKDEVKENTVQEVRKALQANIEAIQRATKLLEKQSDTLTSVMKQKLRELEESRYIDEDGKEKNVYSWRLDKNDLTPRGKKRELSLREKEKQIQADLFDHIVTRGGNYTVVELIEKYTSLKTGVGHNTKAGYKTVINILNREAFEKQRIDKVRLSDAKAWLIKLQQVDGRGYSSIHFIRGVLRPAFQLAVDDDLIRILANRVAPKIEPMVDGYAGFLFLDKNDKPMVALHWEKYLEHIIEKYNKIYRIQMPKVTPHVCRHTFCSNMAKSGMNPKTLQYIMGHSDISVTLNVYTHVQFDDAQAELLRVAKA